MAWWDKLGPGVRVDATARVLANETFEFAAVLGGDVLITQLIGRFTVITGGLSNMHLQFTPDVGTATVTTLCALADINGCDVGDTVTLTGVPGDALFPAGAAPAGAVPGMTVPLILPAGGIESVVSAASGAAAILWSLWYIPLTDGAYVTGV
ncbi:hypothetical protein LCGC14_2262690 [marine sediment metagenome]|uniref:Uncharacterized protein n=1 Tax=marine sediment metagenome TaxID=412755 RepID=A0A0F9CZE2_9ZZZZ